MKKTLLLTFFAVLAFGMNAQTVWNFSNAPFGSSSTINFTANYTTSDGLTIATDGTNQWSLTTNNKTIDGTPYTYRLQTGGGGAPTAPSKIPTTRYFSFNVSGNSTIAMGMISSSSSATRTLIIVNQNETVLDSITSIGGSTASTYTYNYSGPATKLYLYSRTSGINFYYLSATGVVASLKDVFIKNGVKITKSEIQNANNVELEVYNITGKKVTSSKENINLTNFSKGVYIVRIAGTGETQKFTI